MAPPPRKDLRRPHPSHDRPSASELRSNRRTKRSERVEIGDLMMDGRTDDGRLQHAAEAVNARRSPSTQQTSSIVNGPLTRGMTAACLTNAGQGRAVANDNQKKKTRTADGVLDGLGCLIKRTFWMFAAFIDRT
jgi:hypothetical protein